MPTYRTPDVYVEEISLFPPSVAEVETAVPAFIGYTQRAVKGGVENVQLVPTRISSLIEYHEIFGGGPPVSVETIELDDNNAVTSAKIKATFYMYDALRLFFNNGGGSCYIVSLGSYTSAPSKDDFSKGLDEIKKKDEPTILLFPDAVLLGDNIYDVQQQALSQCASLQDRFAVFDLLESSGWQKGVNEFRDKVGINSLKYGAAYTPHLKTTLSKTVSYKDVTGKIQKNGASVELKKFTDDEKIIAAIETLDLAAADCNVINGDDTVTGSRRKFLKAVGAVSIRDGYNKLALDFRAEANKQLAKSANQDDGAVRAKFRKLFEYIYDVADGLLDEWAKKTAAPGLLADITGKTTVITDVRAKVGDLSADINKLNAYNKKATDKIGGAPADINEIYKAQKYKWEAEQWAEAFKDAKIDQAEGNKIYDPAGADAKAYITSMKNAEAAIIAVLAKVEKAVAFIADAAVNYVANYEKTLLEQFPLYKNITDKVVSALTVLPPSGAIAGIYAMVDSNRGVWKAPANVSLAGVSGVTELIDSKGQESLNIDAVAGKSINAIRPFTGKGVLVWGARTLAGNDNEWRYVPVRRFYNMVEESVRKSTYWAVFEPNDANTWIKVKGMIENYLFQKWRDGALAGAKPEEAYFVKIGIGVTMTAQDILEGRMNVEIGMAVVRPAEFIVLKFSHKMQTS